MCDSLLNCCKSKLHIATKYKINQFFALIASSKKVLRFSQQIGRRFTLLVFGNDLEISCFTRTKKEISQLIHDIDKTFMF